MSKSKKGHGWPVESLSSFLITLDQGSRVLKWSTTPTSASGELTANILVYLVFATHFIVWTMAGIEPTTLRLIGKRTIN